MDVTEFSHRALSYCLLRHGSITSWYRTSQHNSAVGGLRNSKHLRALAVDVVYDELPKWDIAANTAHSLGLQIEREPDHDHIEAGD